jgi:hypothetical protein
LETDQIDVHQLDNDGIRRRVVRDLDPGRPNPIEVVVDRAGRRRRRGDTQTGGEVIFDGIARRPAAHHRTGQMQRLAGRGDRPDSTADELGLRWHDEFDAILRRAVAFVEQHVLRACTDIDRQNP